MIPDEIARLRLYNQYLSGRQLSTPEEVVRWFGAIQGQEYRPAQWSLGQRVGSISNANVEKAFAEGRILRTHALRPTWHFVAAEDIRWILKLTASRVHQTNKYYYKQSGLDEATLAASKKHFTRALHGNNHLMRKELVEILAKEGIHARGFQLAYLLMHAELTGLICSGAMNGKQQTYALLEERTASATQFTPENPLAELTRRYFASHGPATIKDFAWWSSLTIADIKKGIEILGSDLSSETVNGRTYWFQAQVSPPPKPAPQAHLIQGYDEYVVAYSESKDAFYRQEKGTGNALRYLHAVIFDGLVVGHWKPTARKNDVHVDISFYAKLTSARKSAVEEAVNRYGSFVNAPNITWSVAAS